MWRDLDLFISDVFEIKERHCINSTMPSHGLTVRDNHHSGIQKLIGRKELKCLTEGPTWVCDRCGESTAMEEAQEHVRMTQQKWILTSSRVFLTSHHDTKAFRLKAVAFILLMCLPLLQLQSLQLFQVSENVGKCSCTQSQPEQLAQPWILAKGASNVLAGCLGGTGH